MAAARKLKVVKSIQAEPKWRPRKGDNSTRALQARTAAKAHRQGQAWDEDEVTRLVQGIERDETTFEIAMSLGRTLYGTSAARVTSGLLSITPKPSTVSRWQACAVGALQGSSPWQAAPFLYRQLADTETGWKGLRYYGNDGYSPVEVKGRQHLSCWFDSS